MTVEVIRLSCEQCSTKNLSSNQYLSCVH